MVSATRVAMCRATAATGNPTASVPAGSYTRSRVEPNVVTCDITFNSDGSYDITNGAGDTGNWLLSGSSGQCEVRWTNTSGSLTTGIAGTWQLLSSNRAFGVTKTNLGTLTVTGTVEIRRTSDNVVIASGSITLTATQTESGGATMTL